jgi:hypothetical protein
MGVIVTAAQSLTNAKGEFNPDYATKLINLEESHYRAGLHE